MNKWVLALQEFNLKIEYIPGSHNIAADTLTRYPRIGERPTEEKIILNKIMTIPFSEQLTNQLKNFATEQLKDPHIRKMTENEHTTKKNQVTFVRRKQGERWRVILPTQIASNLTKELHEATGHPGKYKTYHALAEMCTFRKMQKIIAETIRTCDNCQRNKPLNYAANGKTISHKPNHIMERVSIDLMGPCHKDEGGLTIS